MIYHILYTLTEAICFPFLKNIYFKARSNI